jgi:hypothetical protein
MRNGGQVVEIFEHLRLLRVPGRTNFRRSPYGITQLPANSLYKEQQGHLTKLFRSPTAVCPRRKNSKFIFTNPLRANRGAAGCSKPCTFSTFERILPRNASAWFLASAMCSAPTRRACSALVTPRLLALPAPTMCNTPTRRAASALAAPWLLALIASYILRVLLQ